MRKHYISPKTQTQVFPVSQLMVSSCPTTIEKGPAVIGFSEGPIIIG